jgi:hypothetical protein
VHRKVNQNLRVIRGSKPDVPYEFAAVIGKLYREYVFRVLHHVHVAVIIDKVPVYSEQEFHGVILFGIMASTRTRSIGPASG